MQYAVQMRNCRICLFSGFGLLLSFGFFVTRGDAQPDSFKEIVKGVWFREGDLTGKGHCNNIFIEMKDYLVVVDANFPSGAEAALADVRKVSQKPVRYVFDTHHHGDHAYGNAVWKKNGATTLAYKGVVEEMQRYEPKRWQAAAKERKDVGALNLSTAQPPEKTFDKSPFIVKDETRTIEFHHFGWAHTRGDGFAYLPTEKILCTGDAATNGPYNFTGDGNIKNWPDVMAKAARLDVKHVLPGHGRPGGIEIVKGEGEFMRQLRSAVEKEIKQGKTLEQLVVMKSGSPSSTTIVLPDSVKNWVGPSLAGQVRDAFEEIKANKAHGDLPH